MPLAQMILPVGVVASVFLEHGVTVWTPRLDSPLFPRVPWVRALSNYRLEGFSVERLMNFLTALDRDVHIVIRRKPRSGRTGRILVTAA
jgi:hypothetical protein